MQLVASLYREQVGTSAHELKTRQELLETSKTKYDETKVETDKNLLIEMLCHTKGAVAELTQSGEGC